MASKKLIGEYIQTPKNELVKDHYRKLGFTQEGDFWVLDVNNFIQGEYFITKA